MKLSKNILFLLCCFWLGTLSLLAQHPPVAQGGHHNTQVVNINNHYSTSNKQLTNLERQVKESDTHLRRVLDSIAMEQRMQTAIMNDFSAKQTEQLETSKRIEAYLTIERDSLLMARDLARQKLQFFENVDSLQRRDNFLPFGIKQFKNGHRGTGWAFLATQVVVPTTLGICFKRASNENFRLHRDRIAQTREEHNEYYRKYKDYQNAAIWAPVASAVLIYGVNVLCNRYATKIEVEGAPPPSTGMVPMENQRGGYFAGVSVNFKF